MSEKTEKENAIMVGCALVPVIVALDGLALMFLWGWFATAALGVKPIGYGTAVGVSLLWTFLLPCKDSAPTAEIQRERVMQQVFQPIFYLGLGWVVHAVQA